MGVYIAVGGRYGPYTSPALSDKAQILARPNQAQCRAYHFGRISSALIFVWGGGGGGVVVLV